MGATPGGLPYPEPTDPVAGGPAAIRALAEAIEADTPAAIASGYVAFPSTAVGAASSVSVTFPAGRFTFPPRVLTSAVSGAPATRPVGTGTPTASSVLLYAGNQGGGPVTPSSFWSAIQDRSQIALVERVALEGETFGWVVCPTPGCPNQGEPIEVQTAWVDDAGDVVPVGGFVCGVCGIALDPTDDPPGFGVPE